MNATRFTLMTGVATIAIGASAAWACPDCGDGFAPPSEEPESCRTDLDGDGYTGVTDLTMILNAWGTCKGLVTADKNLDPDGFRPGMCREDLTEDEFIDTLDLVKLFGAWGQCGIVTTDPPAAPSEDPGRPLIKMTQRDDDVAGDRRALNNFRYPGAANPQGPGAATLGKTLRKTDGSHDELDETVERPKRRPAPETESASVSILQ